MSDPVGKKLYNAANVGHASEVSSLLRDHPDIDVNWTISDKWTALHAASYNGYVEVVKLLLAHPDIDVNVKEWGGRTAPPLKLRERRTRLKLCLCWKDSWPTQH